MMSESAAWHRKHLNGWVSTVVRAESRYVIGIEHPPLMSATMVVEDRASSFDMAMGHADVQIYELAQHDCRCPGWEPCELPEWWRAL
jgi:hypothetical protein